MRAPRSTLADCLNPDQLAVLEQHARKARENRRQRQARLILDRIWNSGGRAYFDGASFSRDELQELALDFVIRETRTGYVFSIKFNMEGN
jgi:hypothetical protein